MNQFTVNVAKEIVPNVPGQSEFLPLKGDVCAVCPSDFPEFRLAFGRRGFDSKKLLSSYVVLTDETGQVEALRIVATHSSSGVLVMTLDTMNELLLAHEGMKIITTVDVMGVYDKDGLDAIANQLERED